MDVERTICLKLIEEIIKIPFCSITVSDGEEIVLVESTDPEAITTVMYTTDENYLHVVQHDKMIGWFYLVYGNGVDVISDHTDRPLLHAIWNAVQPTIEELERGS